MAEPTNAGSSFEVAGEPDKAQAEDDQGLGGFLRGLKGDIDEYAQETPDFETTGQGFLIHLCSMYLGIRGLTEALIDGAVNPYLISVMGANTETGGDLSSRIWLTFSMKPIYAILSDLLPILNYKKRWYFVLYAIIGTFAAFALFSFSESALGGTSALGAFFMFFMALMSVAACDALTQGKYSEVAKAKGSAIVTFTYACKTIAAMVAMFAAGFINDFVGPRVVMLIVVVTFGQLIPVAALNLAGDKRLDTYCKPDARLLWDHPRVFALAAGIATVAICVSLWDFIVIGVRSVVLLFSMSTISLPAPGLIWNRSLRVGFGITGCVSLLGFSFYALPSNIARINVYLWMCRVMTLSFGYAIQQWFTASANVCPDGPHFPNAIYQSMGNVMSSLATLFGVWLFQNYVVHWYAPRAFWVTTAFTCIGALFDIMLFTRFNQTLLSWTGLGQVTIGPFDGMEGWSDSVRADDLVSYLFGTQALRSVVDTLDNLPSTLLLSKLCPKGLEVTVFAVLVAFFNLGATMSGQMGTVFLAVYGYDIGKEKDFIPSNETFNGTVPGELCQLGEGAFGTTAIVWGLVVGTIIMPLCTIPLTWVFIPNIRLDQDFVDDEAEGALGNNGGNSSRSIGLTSAAPSMMSAPPRTQSKLSQITGGSQAEALVMSTVLNDTNNARMNVF